MGLVNLGELTMEHPVEKLDIEPPSTGQYKKQNHQSQLVAVRFEGGIDARTSTRYDLGLTRFLRSIGSSQGCASDGGAWQIRINPSNKTP